ncbi:magnesium transporter NIPA-domain-containing protein [Trametes punicea]|nr:magnesium transporter NIPA-domain-containing protein [Trametes punicea]
MSTMSSTVPSTTSSTAASATSSAASGVITIPGSLKVVGIILAIASGLLIGTSFVFKKKGLLRSQEGLVAGEGVAYLKSPLWWIGMTMMILGELCNFAAYAFVEAIVVTPMGALSVVICAILSSIFLKEKLSFFGWLGCGLCILGSVIIALNGPQEASIGQITEFQKLFLAPGFLVYGSILIAASLAIIFYFAPRYGRKSMLWYIMVCSMIGGISVSVTTGLGSAIVTTAMGDNQFKHGFIYFLLVFIAVTLVTEVYYLNVALALFNTVTPTYYVIFTFFSMVTTIVLFQGLKAPPVQIITLVMGFLVICVGITVLQLSKIDPTQIKSLDRRSTILLQAAKSNTEGMDEKNLAAVEDPGMDALRGSFGTVGSIIRARSARRISMSSRATGSIHSRYSAQQPVPPLPGQRADPLGGVKRHQLFDNPMPPTHELYTGDGDSERISMASRPSVLGSPFSQRKQTIKFGDEDVVHSYHAPGSGDDTATHERRNALHSSGGSVKYASVSSAAWSSDAVVGTNGDGEQYDAKANNDGQIVTLTLPVIDSRDDLSDSAGPLTAPSAVLSGGGDVFHHPLVTNPYEGLPSSSTLSSFPSNSSSNNNYGEREHQRSPATSHNVSPASRLRLFGRNSHNQGHPSRHYPRSSRDEDREESENADLEPSSESEGGGTSGGVDEESGIPGGGIRLVPSSTNARRHQADLL